MPTTPNPIFHQGHYNIIAGQFQKHFEHIMREHQHDGAINKVMQLAAVSASTDLIVHFAQRLQKDNPSFDPIKFLDACSPDPDVYPFSEAWEE